MGMLRVKLEREVSNYFFDNGELTMDLQIAVESLVFTGGIPVDGVHRISLDGIHVWGFFNHIVVYRIDGNILTVMVVMPAA
jgi:hypothetical protein